MRRWWHRPLAASGAVASLVGCSQPAPVAHKGRAETAAPVPSTGTADSAAGPGESEVAPTSSPPPGPAAPTSTTQPLTAAVVTIEGLPAPTTSTTFVVPEAEPEVDDETWWASQPGYRSATREAVLACIRSYESGGDYGAVSSSGVYRGAYQFDRQTWASVGGSGDPAAAPAGEQDARAWALYQARGLQPWPTPARRCG